ncbi:ATP-binding domain-containing protein [Flavimaricola marinus]|uniref:ATP-binding domain-containing protein n=1 Tax=Flavimaricola marinus TaxID=1819565 RepID=UPI001FE5E82F|nr:ATP-binding domain-containing protein [Flavimaricola marinus]
MLDAALAVRNGDNILDVLDKREFGKPKRVRWEGEGIELSEVPATASNSGLLAWHLAFQLTRRSNDVALLTPDAKNTIIRNAIEAVGTRRWTWPSGATFGPFSIAWEGGDSSIEQELAEKIGFPASASYDEVCAVLKEHSTQPMVKTVDRRVRRLHRVTGQSEFEKAQLDSFISDAVRTNTRLGFTKSAKIKAMSIHAAKNREFDRVIVLWPQSATGGDEHKRRLLYNAMTRAKSYCTIVVLGTGRTTAAPFAP